MTASPRKILAAPLHTPRVEAHGPVYRVALCCPETGLEFLGASAYTECMLLNECVTYLRMASSPDLRIANSPSKQQRHIAGSGMSSCWSNAPRLAALDPLGRRAAALAVVELALATASLSGSVAGLGLGLHGFA